MDAKVCADLPWVALQDSINDPPTGASVGRFSLGPCLLWAVTEGCCDSYRGIVFLTDRRGRTLKYIARLGLPWLKCDTLIQAACSGLRQGGLVFERGTFSWGSRTLLQLFVHRPPLLVLKPTRAVFRGSRPLRRVTSGSGRPCGELTMICSGGAAVISKETTLLRRQRLLCSQSPWCAVPLRPPRSFSSSSNSSSRSSKSSSSSKSLHISPTSLPSALRSQSGDPQRQAGSFYFLHLKLMRAAHHTPPSSRYLLETIVLHPASTPCAPRIAIKINSVDSSTRLPHNLGLEHI